MTNNTNIASHVIDLLTDKSFPPNLLSKHNDIDKSAFLSKTTREIRHFTEIHAQSFVALC